MGALILLVTGGVDFTDREFLEEQLERVRREEGPLVEVVQGGAQGADFMAWRWAGLQEGVLNTTIHAEWERYGRSAGPRRNSLMISLRDPTRALAFPTSPEGSRRGTWDMIKKLRRARIPLRICGSGVGGDRTTTDWEA
jgi:hypothetical protein